MENSRISWQLINSFILTTCLLSIAGLGNILNIAFPLSAFLISIYIFEKEPVLYNGFFWWLWFLTPFVRRIADWRSGFTDPSPILLAPFLVGMVTLMTLIRKPPKTYKLVDACFFVSIYSIAYGFVIGCIQTRFSSALLATLGMLVPVLFGYHLYSNWENYPNYRQSMQRIFTWGVLIMGLYGVFQYLIAPEWDKLWLKNLWGEDILALGSAFGTPEPLGIRVWSTMNSPLSFSVTMMAGLVLLFSSESLIRFPASACGYLSFLLAQARTAWGGWIFCLFALIFSLKQSLQIKLFLTLGLLVLCALPLLTIEPFSTEIASRFETFQNLENDGSGNSRMETYRVITPILFSNILGYGIANIPDTGRVLDSSVLIIFIYLGILVGTLYFGGFLVLLLYLASSKVTRNDQFSKSSFAIASSALFMAFLGPVFEGSSGTIFWGFLGIGLASVKFHEKNGFRKTKIQDSFSYPKDLI